MKFGLLISILCISSATQAQLSTVSIEGRVLSAYFKKDNVEIEQREVMGDSALDEVDIVATQPVRFPEGRIRESNVVFPLKLVRATSLFGFRYHPIKGEVKFHGGIDLRANYEGVYAFSSGVVERASYDANSGNCVVIEHGGGIKTVYAHLSYIGVVPNQEVTAGALIAVSGNTGKSTAPHLHFSIKYKNTPVDPRSVFKFIL